MDSEFSFSWLQESVVRIQVILLLFFFFFHFNEINLWVENENKDLEKNQVFQGREIFYFIKNVILLKGFIFKSITQNTKTGNTRCSLRETAPEFQGANKTSLTKQGYKILETHICIRVTAVLSECSADRRSDLTAFTFCRWLILFNLLFLQQIRAKVIDNVHVLRGRHNVI